MLELRPDSLTTRIYPRVLGGDAERIYLPVEDRDQTAQPQVIALANDGSIAWHWRGSAGAQIPMAQRRGDRFVVLEASEQRTCRLLLFDAANGAVQREVDVGYDATILNWESSWLDNQAPAIVACESLLDRSSGQRQLICFAVDDGPTFAVPLGRDDGEIERSPLFGDGFVTFGVRPAPRSPGPFRVYAIDLLTQRGAFVGGTKYRHIDTQANPHGMTAAGPYTVLSTTQGLLLLSAGEQR
jgi:hypothetical protein